jgi:hypothetical protein
MAAASDIKCEITLQNMLHLCDFLIERTMQDYRFLKYKPSMIACAAICIGLHTFGLAPWTPTLEYFTRVSIKNCTFRSCSEDLLTLFRYSRSQPGLTLLQAVNDKYCMFFQNSRITPPPGPLPF